MLYQTLNHFISTVHILPKQIFCNFKHYSCDNNISEQYSQYKDHKHMSQPFGVLIFSHFLVSPGLNKGPAKGLWGPDREGDPEIHQADPPRSLLPAQQHDCTQRHQR